MSLSAAVFHPVAIYSVLAAASMFGTLLFLLLKLHVKAVQNGVTAQQKHVNETIEALRKRIEELSGELQEKERQAALQPESRVRPGLNLSKRSQALRMHRRGERPEQIAATLEIPLQEVELLVKVQEILVANVS
jgi:hypothetical protein